MRQQRAVAIAAVVGSLALPTHDGAAQSMASLACGLEAGPTRAVTAVLDGETVRLDDGVEVRLIGALSPRAIDAGIADASGDVDARDDEAATGTTAAAADTDPAAAAVAWPPETETRDALRRLVGGRSVTLAFAGPRTDRYDHVLAHLFLSLDGGDVWVQGRLVADGQARAYALPEHAACLAPLVAREREARAAMRGLWAHAAYQIRAADRPRELARYRHTFQLVRGRVARATGTRNLAILEMASSERAPATAGESQPGAFRVVWKRTRARAAVIETNAHALVGSTVVVRGWVDARGGPEIEIVAAGDIERDELGANGSPK